MVKSINKKEFDEIFIKNESVLKNKDGKNCIVKFSALWCSPCKMMNPILEKVSTEQNIPVYEIDVDEEFELAKMFNIRSIPTLYFVPINGEPKHHVGAMSQGQIEKLIQTYFKDGE